MNTIEKVKLSGKNLTNTDVSLKINEIEQISLEREYTVKVGSLADLKKQTVNISKLTLNQRKKLAKLTRKINSKSSRQTLNTFFKFLTLLDLPKIEFMYSVNEQSWVDSRKEYVELRKQTELARLKYRKAKNVHFKKESN